MDVEHDTYPELNNFAVHLPDLVVQQRERNIYPFGISYNAVVLFADVSGFTKLTEIYSNDVQRGVGHLTRLLNNYIGGLVRIMMLHDCDVLKFAGDAILGFWPISQHSQGITDTKIKETLELAILCARSMQHEYGDFDTPVNTKLHVKISLAYGDCHMIFIQSQNKEDHFCHYVTAGESVADANVGESYCSAGDVMISPNTWKLVNAPDYKYEYLSQTNGHVKIKEIVRFTTSMLQKTRQINADRLKDAETATIRLRHLAIKKIYPNVDKELWKFVIKPVRQKISEKISSSFLNELRQVTIVFGTMQIDQRNTLGTLAGNVQHVFKVIHERISLAKGIVTKVMMFDKGCSFLCAFGLPGFKQDNDCANALHSSFLCFKELKLLTFVKNCAFGVTTGLTFCGTVGHALRHEYTVIGRKVNMAARLMTNYPDIVSCDSETKLQARANDENFHELERKILKGMTKYGTCYSYDETNIEKVNQEIKKFNLPILNQEAEIKIYEEAVKNLSIFLPNKTISRINYLRKYSSSNNNVSMIVYYGDAGMGKTRILDALLSLAGVDTHFFAYKAPVNFSTVGLHTIGKIIKSFVKVDPYLKILPPNLELMKSFENMVSLVLKQCEIDGREKIIGQLLDGRRVIPSLIERSLLPTLMEDLTEEIKTMADLKKFYHYVRMNSLTKSEKDQPNETPSGYWIELLVRILLMRSSSRLTIVIVDDAQFIDEDSWPFLPLIGDSPHSLIVLAYRQSELPSKVSEYVKKLGKKKSIIVRKLSAFDECLTLHLACQKLNVVAVPRTLVKILIDKSSGVPAWIEYLINDFKINDYITIEPGRISKDEAIKMELQYMESAEIFVNSHQVPEAYCNFSKNFDLLSLELPDSLADQVIARIDKLTELEASVLKSASLLGGSFSRMLLVNSMPTMSIEQTNIHISSLFKNMVFECASPAPNNYHIRQSLGLKTKIVCNCRQALNIQNVLLADKIQNNLTKCLFIKFKIALFSEVVAKTITPIVERSIHLRAAAFLEQVAPQQCYLCGGQYVYECFPELRLRSNTSKYLPMRISIGSGESLGGGTETAPTGPSTTSEENTDTSTYYGTNRNANENARSKSKIDYSFDRPPGNIPGQYIRSTQQFLQINKPSDILTTTLTEEDWNNYPVEDVEGMENFLEECVKNERVPSETLSGIMIDMISHSKQVFRIFSKRIRHKSMTNKKTRSHVENVKLLLNNVSLSMQDILEMEIELSNEMETSGKICGCIDWPREDKAFRYSNTSGSFGTGNDLTQIENNDLSDTWNRKSAFDLEACECNNLLVILYAQLTYHYSNACDPESMIHYKLMEAELAIIIGNSSRALLFLHDCHHIMDMWKKNQRNPLLELKSGEGAILPELVYTISKVTEARLYRLVGIALSYQGKYMKALNMFNYVTKLFHLPELLTKMVASKSPFGKSFMLFPSYVNAFVRRVTGEKNITKLTEIVELCNATRVVFLHLTDGHRALALNIIQSKVALILINLKAPNGLPELLKSEAALIEFYSREGIINKARKALKRTLETCGPMLKSLQDYNQVIKLYCVLCVHYQSEGIVQKAMETGLLVRKLLTNVNDTKQLIRMMPDIISPAIETINLSVTEQCLEILYYYSRETENELGMAWFHCLSVTVSLVFPKPPKIIPDIKASLAFCNELVTSTILGENSMLIYNCLSNLGLWYRRYPHYKSPNSSDYYFYAALGMHSFLYINNYLSGSSFYRLIEYQLINLAGKVFEFGDSSHIMNRFQMRNLLKATALIENSCEIFIARSMIYEAYLNLLHEKKTDCKKLINEAIGHSEKFGLKYTNSYAKRCYKFWFKREVTSQFEVNKLYPSKEINNFILPPIEWFEK
ncbi:hypothetical protein SNEBB_003617 [Seison nebaliae]|nr:hypothetical protein SNEBB_003617 [Seison nebaliae]